MKSPFEFYVIFTFLTSVTVFIRHESCAQRIPDALENIRILSSVTVGQAGSRQLIGTGETLTDFQMLVKTFDTAWPHTLTKDRLLTNNTNTSTCVNDLLDWKTGLVGSIWAYNMLDATAKPSSGLLRGATWWIGDYSECLNIKGRDNSSQLSAPFSTAYCSLSFGNASVEATVANRLAGRVIKWDACVPSSCADNSLQILINKELLIGNLKVLQSVCTDGTVSPMTAGAVATICLLSVVVLLVLTATICDVVWQFRMQLLVSNESVLPVSLAADNQDSEIVGQIPAALSEHSPLLATSVQTHQSECRDKVKQAPYGLFGKFLLSFSLCKNARKILSVDASPADGSTLQAIHGIRFLSMSWVILGHTWAFILSYCRNIADIGDFLTSFTFQAIFNATVSVDTFFLLSGTLLSYLLLHELKRVDGPLNVNWAKFIFHRFWRLTPVYMMMLAVFATLFQRWLSGPFLLDVGQENWCTSNWWTNLLYVNNLVFPDKQCFGWAWYLANDMQLFLFSLGFIALIYKHFAAGVLAVSLLTATSCIIPGVLTFSNNYPASTPAFVHRPDFNQAQYNRDIYNPPWCRAGPYLIGVLLGALLYRCNCKVRLHSVLVTAIWCIAAALNITILYGFYNDVNGHYMTAAASAVYSGVHRTLWAIGVAWVIFACVTGYGGFVNTLLSWSALVPLSRLSYAAYLVHPMVIFWYYLNQQNLLDVSYITMLYMFFGNLLLSYAVAFVVSLTFEAPAIGIMKLIIRK